MPCLPPHAPGVGPIFQYHDIAGGIVFKAMDGPCDGCSGGSWSKVDPVAPGPLCFAGSSVSLSDLTKAVLGVQVSSFMDSISHAQQHFMKGYLQNVERSCP